MKVLLFNGSTRKNGCCFRALTEVANTLETTGIETEIIQLGASPVRDCMGCGYCQRDGKGRCVVKDDPVNEWLDKAAQADGFIFDSPVYYAHPTGQLLSVLDRMFYAGGDCFRFKPGAAVLTARRGGATASFDVLNKYFTINSMPIVSSTYWNMAHGNLPEEIERDAEGLQTMRNLGHSMAWLLKSIDAGRRAGLAAPTLERDHWTNFIR